MEAVLALALFAIMATSYTWTLHGLRRNSMAIQRNMQITQILNTHLTETLTFPRIEEGENIIENEEIENAQILTLIEPMELENEEGRILPQMFRVQVSLLWREDGVDMKETVEGWRYARLYTAR